MISILAFLRVACGFHKLTPFDPYVSGAAADLPFKRLNPTFV